MRTLYFGYISPYSRKIRVVLAEKGLEYKEEAIQAAQSSSSFNAINPCRRVPALVDDGELPSLKSAEGGSGHDSDRHRVDPAGGEWDVDGEQRAGAQSEALPLCDLYTVGDSNL